MTGFIASLFMQLGCMEGRVAMPPCSIELPVFNATGDQVPYQVVGVEYQEGQTYIDLLSTQAGPFRVTVKGNRVYFPRTLIRRTVIVTLSNERGDRFAQHVPLYTCQQRTSLQHGERDIGLGDVAWSLVTGKLAGCKLDEHWWIRAMPMFGGNIHKSSFEGHINWRNGSFNIEFSFTGERHIFVVGRGKEPLKVFALDLVVGGKNDAGVIDLRSVCPQ